MTLDEFNKKEKAIASDGLFSCCSAEKWAMLLLQEFPFRSVQQLIIRATTIWYEECKEDDWLEAFSHHPKIGDVKSLEEKFSSTKDLAMNEQSAVLQASSDTIQLLAEANNSYEEKFGFIFIVSATGKSAGEMLRIINSRLKNSYHEELQVAMGEQHKITILRLKKLLSRANFNWMRTSQITTHVLDTAAGKPANGIIIRMQQQINGSTFQTMALSVTNMDGRINDLLPSEKILTPGIYKMVFESAEYFRQQRLHTFYPEVEVQFSITDDQHYHVPLLLNPYGYSTYRGS